MSGHIHPDDGCLLVAEYVDEFVVAGDQTFSPGEVVRPHVVANFLDIGGADDGLKDFTVLLKDDRVVSVRGHGLRLFPSTLPGDAGSYGVVVRADQQEFLVALFRIPEVVGIFCGEIRSDRKIA